MKKLFFLIVPFTITGNFATAQCIDSSLIINGACAQIYDPVCGCDGKIYTNSCEATYWHGVTDFYYSNNFKIKGARSISIGETVELTAVGGLSYKWCTGEETSTITVSPEVRTIYSVTAIVEGGCEFTRQAVVDINESSEALSKVNDNALKLSLYPNPAKKYMNIKSPVTIKKYKIYSMTGELIRSEDTNEKEFLLYTEDLPEGIYALLIETEDQQQITKKIVIE